MNIANGFNMRKGLLFLTLQLIVIASFAAKKKDYQGLLWEISGNGLEKPSYLYGTMHVSNKIAFHLSDTFFVALKNVDMVALESNPATWMEDMLASEFIRKIYFHVGSAS